MRENVQFLTRGKNMSFFGVGTSGRCVGTRKEVNEGEYDRCILYPYMKIKE
jgi:hypothetical protein